VARNASFAREGRLTIGLQVGNLPHIAVTFVWNMANTFGTDILIQAEDPTKAASFYVEQLGFSITDETPNMISLHGRHINLFIERGAALGPVLEVTVDSVEEAKRRLVENGCEIVKDEPDFPRCYVRDPFGLIYNLFTEHV
jgi:predicted enzyme related to lactoylglutathione lyase